MSVGEYKKADYIQFDDEHIIGRGFSIITVYNKEHIRVY